MRTYNVGIIGSGVISRTYIGDIRKFFSPLQVIACADINISAAQKLAAEFQIPRAYTTEGLLNDPDIDIVLNLTPPQCHLAVDRQIIAAGKHLFSEKPFAPTLREAQEILRLAAERGVKVGSAPDTFLSSGLQSVRYYLDSGIIGVPFFVTANMTTFGAETWHPNPAPFYQKGGGPLMDMAPYYLSAIIALLGPIQTIGAFGTSASQTRHIYVGPHAGESIPVETPTHYTAILRLLSGTLVNLNVSFDIYRSNLPMFEIYGDGGTLSYPDPNFGGGTPKVYRKEQYIDPIFRSDEAAEARKQIFHDLPELFPRVKDYSRGIGVLDLAKAIDNGTESRTSGTFITHIAEAMEGLRLSSQSGEFYTMTTTCKRPRPVTPGGYLTDL